MLADRRPSRPTPQELISPSLEIGVYNETDKLRGVALWGPPGPETVLAQFLPPETNLFYSQFDVAGARTEYMKMIGHLRDYGVSVVLVQDLLAQNITPESINSSSKNVGRIPATISDLEKNLKAKGRRLHAHHGGRYGDLSQLDLIPQLLDDDAQRLGEESAKLLNWALCLRHELPSGNIFYGRDQMNVLGNNAIFSSMRWPIRTPEVGLWMHALKDVIGEQQTYQPHGRRKVYLEGGDAIMMHGDVFLGVGGRTNHVGAAEVFKGVESYLDTQQKKLFLVANDKVEKSTYHQQIPADEQETMHLDTFWMPFGDGHQVIACREVVEQRLVYQIIRDNNNHIVRTPIGKFTDFMTDRGIELCDIPREEQLHYATNFLNLDQNTVMVPFSSNTVTIEHFRQKGISVIPIEIRELSGGYGAIHCMTSALLRRN